MKSLTQMGIPTVRKLRKEAEERRVACYTQGEGWIGMFYDRVVNAWRERPMGYGWNGATEREVLAHLLGYL